MTTEVETSVESMPTVGRFCRWPASIDEWLEKKATAGGYLTVQDVVRHILREAREAEKVKEGAEVSA